MNNHKLVQSAIVVSLLGGVTSANATNGDQMLGVTATQWGMAGAVVAAPQDAGTVMTNPAGLAQLELDEFRVDMGFGFMNPPRKANGAESDSNLYLIPSGAMAIRIDDQLTLGLGMAGLSGMGVDFADIMAAAPGNQAVVTTKQFYKISPGFSYRVNEQLSLGAALNIDYQSLALYNAQMAMPQNQVYGFGGSVGMTFKFSERLKIGASYISQQNMDAFKWNVVSDGDDPTALPGGRYEMEMEAPQMIQLGLAFSPSDDLLIEADIKHIAFSDVLGTVNITTPTGGVMPMNFGWDDQTVFALGVQKQINEKTTVRAGYNYGKSPIGAEDVASNYGSLAVTEEHLSLGLTRKLGERISASFSYVHAFNNEVSDGINSLELEQNIVNLQISYSN